MEILKDTESPKYSRQNFNRTFSPLDNKTQKKLDLQEEKELRYKATKAIEKVFVKKFNLKSMVTNQVSAFKFLIQEQAKENFKK
jgi:hypothetical protein